ncbi:MAG: YoaK family protein [Alphaproteobacteria bacterium]
MHSLSKKACLFAVSLSALAGCVDAIGFLQLSGHFVSFMSGNITQLAVGMVKGDFNEAVILMSVLSLFVGGTMMGTWVRLLSMRVFTKAKSPTVTLLGFVTLLLAGASVAQEIGWGFIAIAFMTMAMGAENALFQRNGDTIVGLTYMTGTLVKMGQRLALALVGEEKLAWFPYFLLWAGLLAGGVLGAVLFQRIALHSLWIATLGGAGLMLVSIFFKTSLTERAPLFLDERS